MSFLHGVEVQVIDDGVRPIQVASTSVIGVVGTAPDADEEEFPPNEPVLIAGSRKKAGKLDEEGDKKGTLPDALDDIFSVTGAMVVVVRVEEGEDDDATMSNVRGGEEDGSLTGVHALLNAGNEVGAKPRILCAPGWTYQRPEDNGEKLANPVASEMVSIAERLRGIVIVDGPNTGDSEAIEAREDFGSKRVFFHDPWYVVWDDQEDGPVERPPSARIAAVIARNDNQRGWHTSPSNQLVPGIMGLSRDISFALGDKSSQANHLNDNEIATTIRESGFRLWGNRTTSEDAKWAFLAHVRIADIINDSLMQAHLWAVDRNITRDYIGNVIDGVQGFLDRQIAQRRIAGGEVWADPDLNTADAMQAGEVYFDFDFSPYGVAERITFRSRMHNEYLEEVVE